MKKLIKEIYEELISVFKGKTLDTLLPPIIFIISLNRLGLEIAIIISITLSVILLLYRAIKRDHQKYAIFGLFAVIVASLFAYLNNDPRTYFIPDILGSGVLLLLTIYSLIIKRPLAAYASHITRGWPLAWFWRKDVLPAYQEVTWLWLFYFTLRTTLEIFLFLRGSVDELFWFNTFVGLPLLFGVLTVSYIYGIWRLHRLNGPGVEEFIAQKDPPYKGQTRGF